MIVRFRLLFVVCALLLSANVFATSHPYAPSARGAAPSFAPVIEKAMPAVVNIFTKSKHTGVHGRVNDPLAEWMFGRGRNQRVPKKFVNLGSGVIIDAKHGYVVTNHHVVRSAEEIWVTLSDGRRLQGKFLGGDPETDIAVIKIATHNLTDMPMADSDRVRVGDLVLAMGNPFGLQRTVTSGIVSGVARNNLGIKGYENFIQTDAPINPGNSGGALVDYYGNLVGINTAIVAPAGGNVGVGFAIPSNMVRAIAQQIIDYGNVKRGEIGVSIQDIDEISRQQLKLGNFQGVRITRIAPNGAAAKAGLAAGDVIMRINKKPVKGANHLRTLVSQQRLGSSIDIAYARGGKTRSAQAVIMPHQLLTVHVGAIYPGLAGAHVANNKVRGRTQPGVQIVRIDEPSRAWLLGLKAGDKFMALNRYQINDVDQFKALLKHFNHGDMVFHIYRGNRSFYLALRKM